MLFLMSEVPLYWSSPPEAEASLDLVTPQQVSVFVEVTQLYSSAKPSCEDRVLNGSAPEKKGSKGETYLYWNPRM